MPVPKDETEEKPALTIDLSNKEQVEPVYVDRVVVNGNVQTITIETYIRPSFPTTVSTFTGQTGSSTPSGQQVEQGQSSASGPAGEGQTTTPVGIGAASTTPAAEAFVTILQDTDVPENGVVFLPTPVRVDKIKVTFESPRTPDEPTYKAELAVHACFNYTGERQLVLYSIRCTYKYLYRFGPPRGLRSDIIWPIISKIYIASFCSKGTSTYF